MSATLLKIRGPNVISSYYAGPADDADTFTADGWFRTGDLGDIDPDGYLTEKAPMPALPPAVNGSREDARAASVVS